mmetsp:Transcript_57921/g.152157  ORF Transcript_57921/g.152157 Transcript_57921/m.152157 type:complete len:95 (+) Transcript_57921:173-457(+)
MAPPPSAPLPPATPPPPSPFWPFGADPCPTKAFGQCAGLDLTKPNASLGYNFSLVARQFVCCPAGTSCVFFGPTWGMCMPWFGGVPPRGKSTHG